VGEPDGEDMPDCVDMLGSAGAAGGVGALGIEGSVVVDGADGVPGEVIGSPDGGVVGMPVSPCGLDIESPAGGVELVPVVVDPVVCATAAVPTSRAAVRAMIRMAFSTFGTCRNLRYGRSNHGRMRESSEGCIDRAQARNDTASYRRPSASRA